MAHSIMIGDWYLATARGTNINRPLLRAGLPEDCSPARQQGDTRWRPPPIVLA